MPTYPDLGNRECTEILPSTYSQICLQQYITYTQGKTGQNKQVYIPSRNLIFTIEINFLELFRIKERSINQLLWATAQSKY